MTASRIACFCRFQRLVRSAGPVSAALHVMQHSLPAEVGPVRDGTGTDVMLELDYMGRCAAHDVVCEEKNLYESYSAYSTNRA